MAKASKPSAKSRRPSRFAEDGEPPYAAEQPERAAAEHSVEIGAGGRLVIPAPMRRALGIKIGDRLTVRLEGRELRVCTYEEGLRQARELLARHLPAGADPVDDFLRWKRGQAAVEAARHKRLTRGE